MTFSTLSHNWYDFRKKVIEYKTRVLIFSTVLSETFLILRRTERDMIINVYWSTGKVSVILENCTLLCYYAASSGNFLPTFRDNLSVRPSGFKNA